MLWFAVSCFHSTPPGELPPPPPGICFGRDGLIEKIVGLAQGLNSIALIGAGGIGKTSVALAVLHNDRIKERFGDNRRFIRCDQFSASRANFLNRLSKVIGAGIENPEDLAPLRPSLSSKDIFLVLDNAESILDPQGTDGREIYSIVEELSRFYNVCLCITSRITTVPPDCKCLDVPTLSADAAHTTFYRIYDNDEESGIIEDILKQLDFHPLSVTLLATVAHQNRWDTSRLVKEWERRRAGMLQTEHNKSLPVTIELSLSSPMFRQLGPDARGLLEVVAFFPQGVHEKNLDWLFPTISNRDTIFDKFCILSLTYRINGFITMLAPLREYLCPNDPTESTLLCATRDLYIARLSVTVGPSQPGFEDTRWISSEDVNVEHLFDVFTSADPNSENIWDGCNDFMAHLYWHKRRQTVLGSKIERLPDDRLWKPRGLFEVSQLFNIFGNHVEEKRLLTHSLELWRERGNGLWVAHTLQRLATANRMLNLYEEGIEQAKEASGVFERLGNAAEQARCLSRLARLFLDHRQLDAAEEATIRSVNLLREGQDFPLCESHRTLGDIYRIKGEREKAIHNFNIAIRIATPFNWHDQLFWTHHALAILFRDEGKFDDAHAHIKQAKEYALDDKYQLGCAMETQAWIWYLQGRHEDAVQDALCTIEIFEKLGSASGLKRCNTLLLTIEGSAKKLLMSGETDSRGELLETNLLPTSVNFPFSDRGK